MNFTTTLSRLAAACVALVLCLFACAAASAQEKISSGAPEEYRGLFNLLGIEKTRETSDEEVGASLLVSFSLPAPSLERLARDAKDAGIPLVFRGVPPEPEEKKPEPGAKRKPLINPESVKAFEPLIASGVSVELNPEVFSDYGVRKVPALLLVRESGAEGNEVCGKEKKALLVPGDATLGYMLDRISERKDPFGRKASELRARLGGRE